eukprot:m.341450 g.341450  ORF g.341450 m.341450 type:complete len:388 (-) comp20107_c0_seq1:24-1187(-)
MSLKGVSWNQIEKVLQLGIKQTLLQDEQRERRSPLTRDFYNCELHDISAEDDKGSFYALAPFVFNKLRLDCYDNCYDDFAKSLASQPFEKLGKTGASGALFYRTFDGLFIVKSVQKKEWTFLRKLMEHYYKYMYNNKETTLPRFYGLYVYKTASKKHIRVVVMNNLLPSNVQMHEVYDLKGATYARRRAKHAQSKLKKDLDFQELHNFGINMSGSEYNRLKPNLESDVRWLQSFDIMDYSLLVGISWSNPSSASIKGFHHYYGNTSRGQCVLFCGIIDILQQYTVKKKAEHAVRSLYYKGGTISVIEPTTYADRFLNFMLLHTVFKEEDRGVLNRESVSRTSRRRNRESSMITTTASAIASTAKKSVLPPPRLRFERQYSNSRMYML